MTAMEPSPAVSAPTVSYEFTVDVTDRELVYVDPRTHNVYYLTAEIPGVSTYNDLTERELTELESLVMLTLERIGARRLDARRLTRGGDER